jgi:hypothetical protein
MYLRFMQLGQTVKGDVGHKGHWPLGQVPHWVARGPVPTKKPAPVSQGGLSRHGIISVRAAPRPPPVRVL